MLQGVYSGGGGGGMLAAKYVYVDRLFYLTSKGMKCVINRVVSLRRV